MKTVLLLLYILLVITVIFLERRNPTEALLWALILICVPYVGVLLYFVFGSTAAIKITSAVRRRRLEEKATLPKEQQPVIDPSELSEVDLDVIRFNADYNQSLITGYEDAQIFTTGKDHYEHLFADIARAEHTIYIEFYTIHHDLVGEALVRALTKKAKAGVRVLVLCDFIANLSTPGKMFRPLIEAGGKVIRIKPYLTHFRSHRKIVTIDHRISYIGGMNIGKQYANLNPKKCPWRDTQIRMTGPCSFVLSEYFLNDWLTAVRRKDWDKNVAMVKAIKKPSYRPVSDFCQFIAGGVDTDKESVKMCYLSMIRSAKSRIRIQTPYFIPDSSILDALKTAAATGVQIDLMIPARKSSFFLAPVTTYYVGQLLEYHANVYRYDGYVHAKTLSIDDELCCIGSVNMDIRSLKVDDEICGVFYSNELVRRYSDIYEEDLKHCTPYTEEEFKTRSQWERIKEGIFLPFAPLM